MAAAQWIMQIARQMDQIYVCGTGEKNVKRWCLYKFRTIYHCLQGVRI